MVFQQHHVAGPVSLCEGVEGQLGGDACRGLGTCELLNEGHPIALALAAGVFFWREIGNLIVAGLDFLRLLGFARFLQGRHQRGKYSFLHDGRIGRLVEHALGLAGVLQCDVGEAFLLGQHVSNLDDDLAVPQRSIQVGVTGSLVSPGTHLLGLGLFGRGHGQERHGRLHRFVPRLLAQLLLDDLIAIQRRQGGWLQRGGADFPFDDHGDRQLAILLFGNRAPRNGTGLSEP